MLLAGDVDPVPVARRPAIRALAADPDPRGKLARYARRQPRRQPAPEQHASLGPPRSQAVSDPWREAMLAPA